MSALEYHYKPVELAKQWGFSDDFIRDLFKNEPGVLVVNHPETLHKRGYTALRIPASVAERVYNAFAQEREDENNSFQKPAKSPPDQ
jgi:hypothetical protein